MFKRLLILGLLPVVIISLVACGATPASQVIRETVVVERAVEAVTDAKRAAGVAPSMPMATPAPAAAEVPGLPGASMEQMIIRTGNIRLEVQDTVKSMEAAQKIVGDLGGYVVSSRTWWQTRPIVAQERAAEEKPWGQMTVRVPAKDFDQAVKLLEGLSTKVLEKTTSGQDVTEEYVDLEARLKVREAAEKELMLLLDDVRIKTGRAADIVEIYRELNSIRQEIEQIKGRMNYLADRADMATITINFQPKEDRPIVESGWQPLETLKDAVRSLVKFLQGVVDVGIYLVIWGVVLGGFAAIVAVVIWLIVRAIVRRSRQGK